MACVILICYEGKTEKEYFEILRRHCRIPGYVGVRIIGERGQHKALVDHTLAERDALLEECGLESSEVECWSVCDEDRMGCSYNELLRYAEERDVHLAFARPQFEAYLVQHFEQTGACKKQDLYGKLAAFRGEYGYPAEYNDGVKSDLRWLEEAIDRKPKIVRMAITNADIRSKQTDRCFLTVQRLAERFLTLEI